MASRRSLSSLERRSLEVLGSRASVAAKLLDAWSEIPREAWQSVGSLVELASLGVTEEMAAREVVDEVATLGLATKSGRGYKVEAGKHETISRLALALGAIAYYSAAIHKDQTTAQIVLTRPPHPSELERQLANRGWRTAELETTRDAFQSLVSRASRRVLVMTPFLDARGADWLCQLFGSIHEGVDRILVLRTLESPLRPDYPVGYTKVAERLRDAGVRVFNYSISRAGASGRETFHAKVVLCDEDSAYVGSSNLTAASLD
ncbi:MAG: phospholipase D-like domain-containing protein, partial [Sulfuricaulis sp.]